MELNPTIYYLAIVLILFGLTQLIRLPKRASRKRLIYKLEKAEKMLSKYSGCYSGEYFSAEEYYNDFKIALNELKNGDNSKPDLFYRRFASSYHWDDYVGTEGIKLGNDISSRCS